MIRDVPAYVHGLARNVLREALRERPPPPPPDAILWDSFDRCLAQLAATGEEPAESYAFRVRRR